MPRRMPFPGRFVGLLVLVCTAAEASTSSAVSLGTSSVHSSGASSDAPPSSSVPRNASPVASSGASTASVSPACAALAAHASGGAPTRPAQSRGPARVYTNADLDRIHPFAAQTGGFSTPAAATDAAGAAEAEARPRGRGERYWRDEAARVRERVRSLEERAAGLRVRIAELSRETPVYGRKGGSSPKTGGAASLLASLAALERRSRATQTDLEERARRDGALPGWLR